MTGSRPPELIDRWLPHGARFLERHETKVRVPPERAYEAALGVTLREMPIVRVLFWLRGIRHSGETTIRQFFSTAPFLLLEESSAREAVFGIVGRPGGLGARLTRPEDFRSFNRPGGMKAIANFRVDQRPGGARISTETWVATYGRRAGLLFRAYWLVVGPFSALIRREFLRAARRRAKRERSRAR
jgi:hypothetical protein